MVRVVRFDNTPIEAFCFNGMNKEALDLFLRARFGEYRCRENGTRACIIQLHFFGGGSCRERLKPGDWILFRPGIKVYTHIKLEGTVFDLLFGGTS